jgi:hypothetical protein
MKNQITANGQDGAFAAYIARPEVLPAPAVVVLQELCGVNARYPREMRRIGRAVKRLVRNASETPLTQGLELERNLSLRLCISEPARARMRSYEAMKITAPSRSIEVETGSES